MHNLEISTVNGFWTEKKCSHKYEKWTDVTIGASNAYWQKTSVLNFLNFRILRTLPHTTESHLKAIGLADRLSGLWLNVLTQAGAGCCPALRSPAAALHLSNPLRYASVQHFVWTVIFQKSWKAVDLNSVMVIKWTEKKWKNEKQDFGADTSRLGGLHCIVCCRGKCLAFLILSKPTLNKHNFLLLRKPTHCAENMWGIHHPSICSVKHSIGTMTKICPLTCVWYSDCHGITGSSLLSLAPHPSSCHLSGHKSKFGKMIFLSGEFLVGYQTNLLQLIKE